MKYSQLYYTSSAFSLDSGYDGFGIRSYTSDIPKALIDILKEKNQVTRALGAVSFSYLERRSQETSDDLDLGVKGNVWDIEEKKTVIRFHYEKILSKGTYFLLEKKGLFTHYPNIGLIPKYKYLDDYVQHYGRFEYPDGRKGWVDRMGIEYFDETK